MLFLAGVLLMVFLFSCGPKVEPADLVLHNGKIATVDPAKPEARAIAVRGDAIVAVGSEEEIKPYIGEHTVVADLHGNLAIPGFIESHGHFTNLGETKLALDLSRAANWEEIVAMVAEAAKKTKPGAYILGRGWHQSKWDKIPSPDVEGFPLHDALSKVSPDNPVLLTHASGHAVIANAKAMEAARITRSTPNPPGGDILHDSRGNPAGVFREAAGHLVEAGLEEALNKRTAAEVEADARRVVELASQECLAKGVTSFYDAGQSFATVDFYRKLVDESRLPLRLWVMVNEGNASLAKNLAKYKMIGYGDKRLTVRGIKRLMDGALGSRTAWLLEPYADLAGSTGLNTCKIETLAETARLAIVNGFQLCTHAIGDRANRETLNVYEAAFQTHPELKDLRWRIEHAQHLAAADIPRFGSLGVIAAMQSIHATSDAPYVLARLGAARAEEGAYVWQKLMKSGAIVSNGTDVPVEDVNPIACFHAAVTRKVKDGSLFYPDQCMSRGEALKSYTLNAAYSGFEENVKGSLTPGKLADITVLSKDILTVPESEIPDTVVEFTIVGGKIVYSRKK
jgi:predicted amidohydrolase YtcJ